MHAAHHSYHTRMDPLWPFSYSITMVKSHFVTPFELRLDDLAALRRLESPGQTQAIESSISLMVNITLWHEVFSAAPGIIIGIIDFLWLLLHPGNGVASSSHGTLRMYPNYGTKRSDVPICFIAGFVVFYGRSAHNFAWPHSLPQITRYQRKTSDICFWAWQCDPWRHQTSLHTLINITTSRYPYS